MNPTRTLRIRRGTSELVLVRSGHLADLRGAARVPARVAVAELAAWCAEGRGPAYALRDIVGLLRPVGSTMGERTSRPALAAVTRALELGEIHAYRARLPCGPSWVREAAPDEGAGAQSDAKKKTWVAIELVDDGDPPRPIPGVRWRITLGDGEVREGRTDIEGKARLDGIVDGPCDVTFPDVDAAEWRPL